MIEATVTVTEMTESDLTPCDLKTAIKLAFNEALVNKGKLTEDVITLEGMSGISYRFFINNLIQKIQTPRYLEIGSWKGSTLISAIYGNTLEATAIDNWSLFNGPFEEFMRNLAKFTTNQTKTTIIYEDFREVAFDSFKKVDVYLFDGPHEYKDQKDGVLLAERFCKDEFILIVDDWNMDFVRRGTFDGIEASSYSCNFFIEIRTTLDNQHPTIHGQNSSWHNGYFIGLLTKVSAQ